MEGDNEDFYDSNGFKVYEPVPPEKKRCPKLDFVMPSIEQQLKMIETKGGRFGMLTSKHLDSLLDKVSVDYSETNIQNALVYYGDCIGSGFQEGMSFDAFSKLVKRLDLIFPGGIQGYPGTLLWSVENCFNTGSYYDESGVLGKAPISGDQQQETGKVVDIVTVVNISEKSKSMMLKRIEGGDILAVFNLIDTHLAAVAKTVMDRSNNLQTNQEYTPEEPKCRIGLLNGDELRRVLFIKAKDSQWTVRIIPHLNKTLVSSIIDTISGSKKSDIIGQLKKYIHKTTDRHLSQGFQTASSSSLMSNTSRYSLYESFARFLYKRVCHTIEDLSVDEVIASNIGNFEQESETSRKHFKLFKTMLCKVGLYPTILSGYEARLIFSNVLKPSHSTKKGNETLSLNCVKQFLTILLNDTAAVFTSHYNGKTFPITKTKAEINHMKDIASLLLNQCSLSILKLEDIFVPLHCYSIIPLTVNLDLSTVWPIPRTFLDAFIQTETIKWLNDFYPVSKFSDTKERLIYRVYTTTSNSLAIRIDCRRDEKEGTIQIINEQTITDASRFLLGPKGNTANKKELLFREFWNSSLHRDTLRETTSVVVTPQTEENKRLQPLPLRVVMAASIRMFNPTVSKCLCDAVGKPINRNKLGIKKVMLRDSQIRCCPLNASIPLSVAKISKKLLKLSGNATLLDAGGNSKGYVIRSVRPATLAGYGLFYNSNQDILSPRRDNRTIVSPLIVHYSGTLDEGEFLDIIYKSFCWKKRKEGAKEEEKGTETETEKVEGNGANKNVTINTWFVDVFYVVGGTNVLFRLIPIRFPSEVPTNLAEACLGTSTLLNKLVNSSDSFGIDRLLFLKTVLIVVAVLKRAMCIPVMDHSPHFLSFPKHVAAVYKSLVEKCTYVMDKKKGGELLEEAVKEMRNDTQTKLLCDVSEARGVMPMEVIVILSHLALRGINKSATLHEYITRVFEIFTMLEGNEVFDLNHNNTDEETSGSEKEELSCGRGWWRRNVNGSGSVLGRDGLRFIWELDDEGFMFTRPVTHNLVDTVKTYSRGVLRCLALISEGQLEPHVLFTPMKNVVLNSKVIVTIPGLSHTRWTDLVDVTLEKDGGVTGFTIIDVKSVEKENTDSKSPSATKETKIEKLLHNTMQHMLLLQSASMFNGYNVNICGDAIFVSIPQSDRLTKKSVCLCTTGKCLSTKFKKNDKTISVCSSLYKAAKELGTQSLLIAKV